MKRTRLPVFMLVTAVFALILSACGSPTPTATPRPAPTNTTAATEEATAEVAVAPTTVPTTEATEAATAAATIEATAEMTAEATMAATTEPTAEATMAASMEATMEATAAVTAEATTEVSAPLATTEPTAEATALATTEPTAEVTAAPTTEVTTEPTAEATALATTEPTAEVTAAPTTEVTTEPTAEATALATTEPTTEVTAAPTEEVAMAATATIAATAEATTEATTEATPEVAVTATPTIVPTLGACKTSGELLVASDAAYPPFESVDTTTNQIVGFDIDLLNAIGASQGFTVNVQNAPFDTIFINLAAGQYDLVVSAATITEERQKTVSFSDPYFVAGQVIIVRAADKDTVSTPDDLIGKKIGVQLGTTGAEAAKGIKDAKVSEYPTFPEAAQALANGDVDAVVNDNATSLTYILNTPDINLVVVGAAFTTENYGIAVRKDCGDLLAKINAGLAEAIASGKYAEIYRKYFGENPAAEFMPGSEGMTPEATTAATEAPTVEATTPTTEPTTVPTAEATVAATATP